jgi:quercetin dioxygenase-like cupin family protein
MKALQLMLGIPLMISLILPLTSHAEASASETMGRQLLLKHGLEGVNEPMETRVIRVSFPPGFKTPLHTHDAQGPRYVLKGRLKVEDHGATQTYGPGDTFWESGAEMTIENVGGSDAEMVIFEVAGIH